MEKIRTFICIEIPADILSTFGSLQNSLKSLGRGVRWTRTEGIHLTLKFLGDVEGERIKDISEALVQAKEGVEPFTVLIKGQGAFPNLKQPRVFWIGVEDSTKSLWRLQERIENSLLTVGFKKEERRYSPHLTLGRVKERENVDLITDRFQKEQIEESEFTVKEIVIMKSELKSSGAVYTPLQKIKL